MIKNEAEILKVKERLVNANGRIQACNNIELESSNEREQLQPKVLEDNWMRSTKMDNDNRVAKIGIEQKRGADDINRKELNAQYINTFYLQDKMD